MTNALSYITPQVGIPILSEPYVFSDSDMAVFVLDSDASAINQLLDTQINDPSEGKYKYRAMGIGGRVMTVMIMAQMTVEARKTPTEPYGKERYSELSFWVPCYDRKALKKLKFEPALYLPLLYPDSFSAIATGREMFGFPKQLANYVYPGGKLNVLNPNFTASTMAFKTIGEESVAQQQTFLSVGDHRISEPENGAWKTIDEAGAFLTKELFSGGWTCGETGEKLGDIANNILEHFPGIFLKQFPSVQSAQASETRSITSAPFQLLKFYAGFPWLSLKQGGLKTMDLNFTKLASVPIVDMLGLTPSSSTDEVDTVPSKGFWVKVDFGLKTGQTMEDVPRPKKKIAVLGGGLGSLATMYGITESPNWQEKYDITCYQLGWRLGGKGASGRNREVADRVEEHGLHIWFGYYTNSFKAIQKCYAEMNRPSNAPLATWDQAFKPQNNIVVEEYVHGKWHHWRAPFRPNDEVPGTAKSRFSHPIRLLGELRRIGEHLLDELIPHKDRLTKTLKNAKLTKKTPETKTESGGFFGKIAEAVHKGAEALENKMEDAGHKFIEAMEKELDERIDRFRGELKKLPHFADDFEEVIEKIDEGMLQHWENVIRELEGLMAPLLEPFVEVFESIRRFVLLIKLGIAVGLGIIRDGVLLKGYNAINHLDFTEWLKQNGASDDVANSVIVRAFYDLYLGFPNGKSTLVGDNVAIGGNVCAGELLHSYVLVGLCYQGAVMWKMQAGMGDTVMTPFYQVLKQRGVKFEFFNEVADLKLTEDKKQIGSIDINVQATLVAGDDAEYNPLYNVRDLPCWPSEPLYEQLVQGPQLKAERIDLESPWSPWKPVGTKTLKLGEDFDEVVLGISVAALPYITQELIDANERWATMLEKSNTSQTQAMQLWINNTLEETGWPYASPILDAYADPFNTWAVMDQTLDKENWPQDQLPFSIAYFCNNLEDADPIPPFSDHEFPATQKERVFNSAEEWLSKYTGHLWPWATVEDGKGLDYSLLVDLANREGVERLRAQYFRANIAPTERYVTNAANTNQYRLKPGDSGFDNLKIAGDWTDNGNLNLGNVESTMISGLLAAEAVTGADLDIVQNMGGVQSWDLPKILKKS